MDSCVYIVYNQRACSDNWYDPYHDVTAIFHSEEAAVVEAQAQHAAHKQAKHMEPQCLYFVKRHAVGKSDVGVWVYSIDSEGMERRCYSKRIEY